MMCDTTGCAEAPEYLDNMDNKLCFECMSTEIQENDDLSWKNFETIGNVLPYIKPNDELPF
jgi:hypothetical protein